VVGSRDVAEYRDLSARRSQEKLEALAAVIPPTLRRGHFKAPDKLLTMLKSAAKPSRYAER
jgi:hypothetical protein